MLIELIDIDKILSVCSKKLSGAENENGKEIKTLKYFTFGRMMTVIFWWTSSSGRRLVIFPQSFIFHVTCVYHNAPWVLGSDTISTTYEDIISRIVREPSGQAVPACPASIPPRSEF